MRSLVAVLAFVLLAPLPVAAQAVKPAIPFGHDRVAQRLANELSSRFSVQVLRAQREQLDGKPVYRMVVMNPGGDFNEAYAVHTLVVDAKTGALVSQFQNETSGYQLSAPPDRTPRDNGVGTAIRRETFFKP